MKIVELKAENEDRERWARLFANREAGDSIEDIAAEFDPRKTRPLIEDGQLAKRGALL